MTVIRNEKFEQSVQRAVPLEPVATSAAFDLAADASGTTKGHIARVSEDGDARLVPEFDLEEMETEFDPEDGAYWCYQKHCDHPSFTPGLLRDVRKVQTALENLYGGLPTSQNPIRYLIWASRHPTIFNLGGDLRLIAQLISARNVEGLRRYARACIDICYPNYKKLNMPAISAALIQGDALGGGFEAALSCDLLVAEKGTNFGLPEVLFNLFPGMGAYSFLARKIGAGAAERIIMSGKVYTADEMHEMGVVDVLAEKGMGEEALMDHIRKHGRQHNAQRAIYRVRDRFSPVTLEELTDITEIWVDTALNLEAADLRRMERLVKAQRRRNTSEAAAAE